MSEIKLFPLQAVIVKKANAIKSGKKTYNILKVVNSLGNIFTVFHEEVLPLGTEGIMAIEVIKDKTYYGLYEITSEELTMLAERQAKIEGN